MSCLNQSWTPLWGPAGSLLSGTAVGGSWLAGSPSISVHTDPPAHAGAGTPCAQAGSQVPVLSLSRAAAPLATYGTARQDATRPAPALGLHQLTLPPRCPVLPSAARPVPAHPARGAARGPCLRGSSPLLPGRGTFHVCHYVPSAGRAAPSSPAPAPSFPQQTGAFPSPWQDACHRPLGSSRRGKELADRLKARACWRWFHLLQGGSHPAGYSPWDAPRQKHPRELNDGSPRAGAQHGAGLRTPGREAAVTNPVHRLPPAGAVPCGAASVLFPRPAP